MEYGKHLNTKKLLVFLSIFVILFVIIFASALLTSKAKNSKQKKAESNNKGQSEVVSKNETQEENVVSNEVATNTSENENNQVENDTTSKNETKPENENTQKPSGSSTSGKKLPVSNPDSIQLCKQAQSGDEKNIYLTFDDGPSPNITPQVLKVLKQYDVPATFFVLGSRVELYPELVKQYNCLAVEMETFALFQNAKLLNKKAACILTISDSFVTKTEISSEQREKGLDDMIKLALESCIKL